MKLAIVSDVWQPLVNCIVATVQDLRIQLQSLGHEILIVHPGQFASKACPGYPSLQLAWGASNGVAQQLDAFNPDAIHLATEGPLGWLARRYCMQRGYAFTTSYHTRLPEVLHAQYKIPVQWGYALLKKFHKASSAVMVPVHNTLHQLEGHGFKNLCAWTHGVDSDLFKFYETPQFNAAWGTMARPVSLFVGNVVAGKNLEDFLSLDVPGTKVVCGEGALKASLQLRYPSVRWLGQLTREQLAAQYAAADILVMPAHKARFSLVMLEALSCGLPVVARPTQAACEILGPTPCGGALDHDLKAAWYKAQAVARHEARARSQYFSWQYAALMFVRHLVFKRGRLNAAKSPHLSAVVTKLSSKS
jgi:glycosyltransferase involved in cell wall biosynthesis